MKRLAGKTAVITGAAGTIGHATARRFLDEGARVVIMDREESELTAVASDLVGETLALVADVTEDAAMRRAAEAVAAKFGPPDIVFANAGIAGPVGSLLTLDVVDFDRVIAVNVRGVFLTLKHFAPLMADDGSIIATSSVAGLRGAATLPAYAASKHAVMGLVTSAAAELAPRRIRVNAINPGPVEGRMMRGIESGRTPQQPDAAREANRSRMRLGRYVEAEEVASLVLYLASDESRAVTGRAHVIDSGYLL